MSAPRHRRRSRLVGFLAGVWSVLAVVLMPSESLGAEETPGPSPTQTTTQDPEPTPTQDPEPTPTQTPEPTPTQDPEPTPSPTPTETVTETATPTPTPTVTETATETVVVTETATPEPAPSAPGEDSGVFVDPSTGSLRVDENTGVALGVAAWLASVVAGLSTASRLLP